MNNKESFVFYEGFKKCIDAIPNTETKLKAYEYLTTYGLYGIPPPNNVPYEVIMLLQVAMPQIDKSKSRYKKCVQNGKKGGAPKGNNNAKKHLKNNQENNHNDNENENLKENENLNEKERDKKEFFLKSLSQKFPLININVDVENINLDKYDPEKIFPAISNSNWLQKSPLSFILNNYTKVINGEYANITPKKNCGFETHNYTKEQLNSMYDDINNIEL